MPTNLVDLFCLYMLIPTIIGGVAVFGFYLFVGIINILAWIERKPDTIVGKTLIKIEQRRVAAQNKPLNWFEYAIIASMILPLGYVGIASMLHL